MKGILRGSLLLLLIGVSCLNTLPYLKFADQVWQNALLKGEGFLFWLFSSRWGELAWSTLGIGLWFNLQILELLPELKTKISRKLARQIRLIAYGVDCAIVFSIYPLRLFPPDWINFFLILFALFAIEAVAYVYQKV